MAPAAGVLTVAGANGTATGRPPALADLAGLAGKLDIDRLARLVELTAAEGERQLADARTVADQAAEVIRRKESEVRRLHRVLEVLRGAPDPLGKGSRLNDGEGSGYRASRYLLEVATTRYRQSGVATFSTRVAVLACKGWPETTISGGLRRLVKDGYAVRVSRGQYALTEKGQQAPPAPAGTLPLLAPGAPAEATP